MKPIQIDGSDGEGGGQVLRTSLALSALTGRAFEIANIRASRKKPGLKPQHLTAVRATAAICDAELEGDELNSRRLAFRPGSSPLGGEYCFDVRDVAKGGSAGSASLIAQAVALPLAYANQMSRLIVRGGTHVPWSPPFHYFRDVFLSAVGRMGVQAEAQLDVWGWYPIGGGEFSLIVHPLSRLEWLNRIERGGLVGVTGVAAVTNLPAHIPQRMANRAMSIMRAAGIPGQTTALRERGPAAGAGIFLTAEYSAGAVGFSALGRRGKPAEEVAEEACNEFLRYHENKASAVDPHLADQLILPMALATGDSTIGTSLITEHTLTNIDVVHQFLDTQFRVDRMGRGGIISVTGIGYHV